MKPTKRSLSKLLIVTFGMVVGLTILMSGEPTSKHRVGTVSKHHVGLVEDWSSHHLIFSDLGTYQQAITNGTYSKWLTIQYDARFIMQQMKRNPMQPTLGPAPDVGKLAAQVSPPNVARGPIRKPWHGPASMKRDWSVSLGVAGVATAMEPAKYTWDTNATPDCTKDYVVFPVNTAGVAPVEASQTGTVSGAPTAAQNQTITITNTNNSSSITLTATPTVASITGTFATEPDAGSTLTIKGLGNTLILTAQTNGSASSSCTFTSNSSTVYFVRNSTTNTNATHLAALINITGCGSAVGVGASAPGSNHIVITASTAGSAGDNITVQASSATGTNFQIAAWDALTDLAGGLDATNSGTDFSTSSSSASTEASHIATAITNNGGTVGVSASSSGTSATATVTVTATSPGPAGDNITLAQTMSNFSWSGGTNLGNGAGQANLIGFNHLYSTSDGSGNPFCAGTGNTNAGPSVLFAYDVGAGTVQTSPAISLDGTQVAYVESVTGGSKFHVLTIGTNSYPGEGASAGAPCIPGNTTSPCNSNAVDIAVSMSGGVSVTRSSPFVDYTGHIAYVGDDSGKLHKFTGVFNGTPAEAGSPWPVTVSTASSTGKILSGPVYDSGGSGNIFVGDGTGELFSVLASTGAVTGLTTIGPNTSCCAAISDPPIVDSTAEMVYTQEGTTQGNNCTGQKQDGYLIQVDTSLNPKASIDLGASGLTVHSGAFDQAYFDAAGKGGYYYYCAGSTPSLRLATFTSSGVMTSDTHTLSIGSSGNVCSPLTEVFNTTTAIDWLFLGSTGGTVKNLAITDWEPNTNYALGYEITDRNLNVQKVTVAGTSGGTEPSWNTGTGTKQTSDGGVTWTYQAALAATASGSESGGTSGIIVDNVANTSTYPQASSIYFGTLTGNTAVKLTQAGLQ